MCLEIRSAQGCEREDRTWPEVLQDLSGHRVVNCARAGATVDAAHRQAVAITEPSALVIIEIGGNDLLGATEAASYYENLDRLVEALAEQHPVLLVVD
ncbi:MAG: lysophospholipase L1-like esterase [Lentimonas sp.]|jgi:lysophospholipase L1-like esterase